MVKSPYHRLGTETAYWLMTSPETNRTIEVDMGEFI